MRTRTLRTGTRLTEIGFGAAQLGNLYRETTDEEAVAAVDRAWERGIRYFDTAPHYGVGLSERRLGGALANRPRSEFVLSTKVGRLLEHDPAGAGLTDDEGFAVPATTRRRRDYSRDGVRKSIEDSLRRLDTDRIDIAYVHDPDDYFEEVLEGAIPSLIELREEGVLAAVGVGMNQSAMLAEFVRRTDIDLVMVAGRYSLLDQTAFDDLVPVAADRGVALVAAGVFNSGLLSKDRASLGAKFDYEDAPVALVDRANRIADETEAAGSSLPTAAIAFPLQDPLVASVVIGMRTAAQVDQNLDRAAAEPSAALWDVLLQDGLIRAHPRPAVSAPQGGHA